VRRLAPYFEAPFKAEDANSPIGPLQHHVAEPDLDAWESIDWAALSLGHNRLGEEQTNAFGAGDETTTEAPNEAFNFGTGHGFACTSRS
jgi:hypothetical protein